MAETSDSEIPETLQKIFKDGLDLYNNLGRIDEPTNSPSVQSNVKKSMHLLEDATRLVSIAGIFSSNESADEISTNNLQYLLLPALLGSLSLKLTSGDRKEIINIADIYFKDFLQRCNDYGLSDFEVRKSESDSGSAGSDANKQLVKSTAAASETEMIRTMVCTRASKIQRFKEQQELRSKLAELKTNSENENADDEIKRNYFLAMIKLYIYEAIDELQSIEMEKPILDHMATLKPEELQSQPQKPKRFPSQPLKPIIITKDAMQKAVYGAGYPSIPSMTVAEFYEKRVADGVFPDPTKKKAEKDPAAMSLYERSIAGVSDADQEDREQGEMEKKEEDDDEENLARLRQKDEFKDEHRRGWGNRMNRS